MELNKQSRRMLQSERDMDPKQGKFKWRHTTLGTLLANTKSEAIAKFKHRGKLGKFPVEKASRSLPD